MSFLYPVMLIVLSLFCTGILSFLPYMARRTECFSIAIPEKEYCNQQLRLFRKRYAAANVIAGILIFAVSVFLYAQSESMRIFVSFIILLQYFIAFLIYQYYRRQVKKFKESSAWKDDIISTITIDLSNEKKGYPSSAWLIVYAVIIAGTILLGFLFYSRMPARVPMHYDANGIPNGYARKSYVLLFAFPLVQLFLASVFSISFFVVKSRRRRIDPSNEEESLRRQNVFRISRGRFFLIGGTLMLLMFAAIQMTFLGILNAAAAEIATLVVVIVMLLYSVFLAVKIGQGGSRVKCQKPSAGKLSMKDSDEYWKFGVLYWNPNDPAIFVEKRWGMGYTLNLARPAAYVIVAALVLGILALTAVLKLIQ